MLITPLEPADWTVFKTLAAAEGWTLSFHEQRLFLNHWRPFFFTLKQHGEICGFVSAVTYKRSGWIGNLLVAPEKRGLGYGSALLEHAISSLRRMQPDRIWLTASAQGAPLYRRRGFQALDVITRWTGYGLGTREATNAAELGMLIDLDTRCWGESRAPLLSQLEFDGLPLCSGKDRALLQSSPAFWQLGPWLSATNSPTDYRNLLQQARAKTPAGRTLLADIFNSAEIDLILRDHGFSRQGSNELMCLSDTPVEINGVVALASLGSIG